MIFFASIWNILIGLIVSPYLAQSNAALKTSFLFCSGPQLRYQPLLLFAASGTNGTDTLSVSDTVSLVEDHPDCGRQVRAIFLATLKLCWIRHLICTVSTVKAPGQTL